MNERYRKKGSRGFGGVERIGVLPLHFVQGQDDGKNKAAARTKGVARYRATTFQQL
jgi:hypothetical protein